MDKYLKGSLIFNLSSNIWFYSISHKLCCDTYLLSWVLLERIIRHGDTTCNIIFSTEEAEAGGSQVQSLLYQKQKRVERRGRGKRRRETDRSYAAQEGVSK